MEKPLLRVTLGLADSLFRLLCRETLPDLGEVHIVGFGDAAGQDEAKKDAETDALKETLGDDGLFHSN